MKNLFKELCGTCSVCGKTGYSCEDVRFRDGIVLLVVLYFVARIVK